MDVERMDLSEWQDALPGSGFEPFHLPAVLELLDEYADADLELYGAFKGQQPVALFPAFVAQRSMGRAVLSPPPSMAVSRLGPILMPASPKQRKQEQVSRRFAEALLEELDVDSRRTLFRMLTPAHADPRPYRWNDLEVEPEFTYHLDVTGKSTDDILSSFSRDLRKDITSGEDLDVTVGVEGVDAARRIYDSLVERYDEQDESFAVPWGYIRDVIEALEDRSRVYVARGPDGEFLNGMLFLYSNDAAYSWLGGARGNYESVSTKSLVQWAMLEDLVEDPPVDSITRWDMSGANTERLCRYKSAWAGTLVPYYRVESGGKSIDLAKKAYSLVRT